MDRTREIIERAEAARCAHGRAESALLCAIFGEKPFGAAQEHACVCNVLDSARRREEARVSRATVRRRAREWREHAAMLRALREINPTAHVTRVPTWLR
jgi:hypothetical protein